MLETILCFFRGEYVTLGEHAEALLEVSDKIDAAYKEKTAGLQLQIDDLKKQLKDAEAKAEHLQAAVENLRGDLSVSNGSRDRAHIKISAAMKALQS